MDYKFEKTKTGRMKVKEEFTPARRWSFLVGANEKSHTAQSRLINMLANDEQTPTLEEIEKAFDIETVTKEFFLKYRELFLRTKEELDRVVNKDPKIRANFDDKDVDTVNFAKKLLGQIVFLYFLQKKGWFGVGRDDDWGTGSKHFLRKLFDKKHADYNNFFNDILEPLFYEALRIDRSHDDGYYSRFDCKIPFLNGGLFDPIGNYDWVHTDIIIPDKLFSNKIKTKEGDTGTGILDVFDRYNFTVKEDEPLEKEVAIDPELLGKSYEKFNAIRPDNFDEFSKTLKSGKKGEENKFNKKFGVYYTPREIVHYMCQQSLINYLATEVTQASSLSIPKKDIEILIHTGEQVSEIEARVISEGRETRTYSHKLPESIRTNAERIDDKLANITVCDPAVGSGAFPVGMMSEIVKTRNVLTAYVNNGLQRIVAPHNRTMYDFKRRCIEHTLYGVDIDPGAVEIAKLRLWLSLVVDEDDIKNIKPLPNLDYKIVCGNSLFGVEKNLFNNELFNELEKLKPLFFNETNPTKKQEYKKQIDKLISQITNGHKEFDFEVYFSEVFHQKGGFDVVIANPPYIQLQKSLGDGTNNKFGDLYKNCGFTTFTRTGDIYALFYEKGINVLKECGHLVYITSNKWMRAGYGDVLRGFFAKHNPKILLDFGGFKVFESATVDTNIMVVENCENGNRLEAIHFKNDYKKGESVHHYFDENKVILGNLTADTWFIGNKEEVALKEKIESIGTPLKDWDMKINFGIKTGCNEAFIINEAKRDELITKDQKSAEIIKPILRGRDIKRYGYKFARLYLIDSHNGYLDKNYNRISPIKIDNYPVVKEHLDKNWTKIKKRQDKGVTPYNLRNCAYYPEFAKEKVVWTDITTSPTFSLVPSGLFFNNTVYSISGDHRKYLLAILNSSIVNFIFPLIATDLGEKGNRYFKIFVEKVPIMPITSENRYLSEQIKGFVEQILTTKRTNLDSDTTALEAEIDQLVYKLYDLTEEEIKIVEGG